MMRNNHTQAAGVACFGEILLRLAATHSELLLQTRTLVGHIGGAEANVAVALAQWGHFASAVSVLPDNALGHAAAGELRRYGVRTDSIQFRPGRMGLYFLTVGAGHRPSEVLYDREGSAFALAPPELIDWNPVLAEVSWLHLSGITPAVGPQAAEAALRAARAARALGVAVSFDCNYRAKLWERWHGDARPILRELVDHADLLFAEQRDIALILGRSFEDVPAAEQFRVAGTLALETFSRLKRIATTVRVQRSVDEHELSAALLSREGLRTTRTYSIGRIIDRIGSGDAFAAGILHGVRTQLEDQDCVDFGLAAAVLKHSIPGDFNLVGIAEVQNLLRDAGFTVRR
ncbi:MAG TPA: sugar kinase [Xanthobacteraceae bacterium]|jgi:2-dehydro-3-deoxygluconokinase